MSSCGSASEWSWEYPWILSCPPAHRGAWGTGAQSGDESPGLLAPVLSCFLGAGCVLPLSPCLPPSCLGLGLRVTRFCLVRAPRWPSWERTGWGPGTKPGLMEEPRPGLSPPPPSPLVQEPPHLPPPSTVIAQRFSRELTKQRLPCEENKAKHVRVAELSSPIPSPLAWNDLQRLARSPRFSAERTPPEAPVMAPLLENPGGQGTLQSLPSLGFRQF